MKNEDVSMTDAYCDYAVARAFYNNRLCRSRAEERRLDRQWQRECEKVHAAPIHSLHDVRAALQLYMVEAECDDDPLLHEIMHAVTRLMPPGYPA